MRLNWYFNKQFNVIQYLQRVFWKNAFLPIRHTI
jgi:hypothetical protein